MAKCKACKIQFKPSYSKLQSVCSPKCAIEYASIQLKKESAKKWKEEKKERKEKLLTTSDWLQLLQQVFNAYIRERDYKLPCISCGTTANVQYHAGHFYTVGAYPNLRFDEDNVHKQCGNNCNRKLHGNVLAYREGLIQRIGEERFQSLESRKQTELKLTLPEIKELIQKYRKMTKELEQIRKSTVSTA